MAFCPDCGAEVEAAQAYCSDCGAALDSTDEPSPPKADSPEVEGAEEPVQDEGFATGRALASLLMGLIVGGIVALGFSEIGGAPLVFLVTLAGVTYYLYSQKDSVRGAIGSGCYITAIWLPLAPVLFYIGFLGKTNTETATGAGETLGSVFGMFIWGFVGLIIGIAVAGAGYLIKPSNSG